MAEYKLTGIDYTEEGILNSEYPNRHEPITGWRRFRINYRNEQGFSNVEGTIYIPKGVEPYVILDKLMEMLNNR